MIKRYLTSGNPHSGLTISSGMILILVGGSRTLRLISDKQQKKTEHVKHEYKLKKTLFILNKNKT